MLISQKNRRKYFETFVLITEYINNNFSSSANAILDGVPRSGAREGGWRTWKMNLLFKKNLVVMIILFNLWISKILISPGD